MSDLTIENLNEILNAPWVRVEFGFVALVGGTLVQIFGSGESGWAAVSGEGAFEAQVFESPEEALKDLVMSLEAA